MKAWELADLEPLRQYLIEQRNQSRYTPVIPYVLD